MSSASRHRVSPTFFASPAEFRRWLGQNHLSRSELWVGYHKKGTSKPSMTWPESVEQALCYGWIDGLRRSLGPESYVIRFTPRRPTSVWSAINIANVKRLSRLGLMTPAGLKAYRERDKRRVERYSFEQERVRLSAAQQQSFKASPKAWTFFLSQPTGYRRTATWWVVSAKQETTRARRLRMLIRDSERGLRIAPLRRTPTVGPAKKGR